MSAELFAGGSPFLGFTPLIALTASFAMLESAAPAPLWPAIVTRVTEGAASITWPLPSFQRFSVFRRVTISVT